MPEPQQADDNPYLATQVADIATSISDRKTPGPVAIIFAILLGATTAVVTFCVTFFFTCLGLSGSGNGMPGATMTAVFVIAIVTAVAATWFAVWGFLNIVKAVKSTTNRDSV